MADLIDLRSDTVTRPTPGMRDAMVRAELGDDVYGEDPTVKALEEKAADLFGMEAALFCASGTMTNQIAINVHTRPGDEVICHHLAHIYIYEGGGIMANSGASVRTVGDASGMMSAEEVAAAVNPTDVHRARSRLVAIENTSNRGGGSCLPIGQLQAIGAVAQEGGLGYHLDGARLFNALVATGERPRDYGRLFDSISICLSKGLGCPVGSVLLGERDFIREALRVRKRFGGGWRQAGMLAAAGIYALDHHVDRLAEDHQRAARLGRHLAQLPYATSVRPVQTNIVVLELENPDRALGFIKALREAGVRASHTGGSIVRMVTHLDLSDEDINRTCEILATVEL
ncbi:MAG TPA: GntG family PLP-dependent aldolase [Pseudomonadales bacterium]